MEQKNDKPTVLFMLAVMTFAVVLVDDRWVRAGLALLPTLLLAQRALLGAGVGAKGPPKGVGERRSDVDVRGQVEELLKLIREFYTMCHVVADGRLEPTRAKARAQVVESQLNEMMAQLLDKGERVEAP
jgi:hypothetical protein